MYSFAGAAYGHHLGTRLVGRLRHFRACDFSGFMFSHEPRAKMLQRGALRPCGMFHWLDGLGALAPSRLCVPSCLPCNSPQRVCLWNDADNLYLPTSVSRLSGCGLSFGSASKLQFLAAVDYKRRHRMRARPFPRLASQPSISFAPISQPILGTRRF